MEKEKLDNLLNELSERMTEPVRPGLAEDIKRRIPSHLVRGKGGLSTIRIIIDLRVSRLAAAAAIIATTLLCTFFFDSRDSSDGGLYQDGKIVVKYLLKGEIASSKGMLARLPELSQFFQDGREVFYYGGGVKQGDKDAILMHWKLSEDSYRVIYGDFRTEVVGAGDLVKLQAKMLQKKQNNSF